MAQPLSEQNWPSGTVPVVSICCLAYNHENFIRECLDGFLMQETTFPVEILIHDDASIDNTVNIIREYETKYPQIINPIYQSENQYSKGIKPSIAYNFPRAKGKYIALCEGDDYWIDPLKLQKQVDFLNANSEYSLCAHNSMVVYEDGYQAHIAKTKIWNTLTVTEILLNYNDFTRDFLVCPTHTSSIVYRKAMLNTLPDWLHLSTAGDLPIMILQAQNGPIKFLPDAMSVYRIHNNGISSGSDHKEVDLYYNRLYIYENLYYTLNKDYKLAVNSVINMYYQAICSKLSEIGKLFRNNIELEFLFDNLFLKISNVKNEALHFTAFCNARDSEYEYKLYGDELDIHSSIYACLIMSLAGEFEKYDSIDKEKLCDYFSRFQSEEDGLFYDNKLLNKNYPSCNWWWTQHLAVQIVACYKILGKKPSYKFKFLEKFYDLEVLADFLETIDVDNHKVKDNEYILMSFGALLQFNRDFFEDAAAGSAVVYLQKWLLSKINTDSGLWGSKAPQIPEEITSSIQFYYQLYLMFEYDKVRLPYREKVIDWVLRTQNSSGGFGVDPTCSSACEDIASIDILIRYGLTGNYKTTDIIEALLKAVPWIISNYNENLGAVFSRAKSFQYGHALMNTRENESSLFATWLRTLSLAYITNFLGRYLENAKLLSLFNIDDAPGYTFLRRALVPNDNQPLNEFSHKKLKIILVQLTYPSSPFPGPNLPVGLGYIAEQLELHNIHYEVVDLSIDSEKEFFNQIAEATPEYVALSMMSLDAENHYELAIKIKKQFSSIKIVAGGAHISFIQVKALQNCPAIDFGVVHEGEHTLIELLNGNSLQSIKGLIYRGQDGAIIYTGDRQLVENIDQLSFPRYQKFKLSRYAKTLAIASSRGCPFSCTFCGAFLSMGRKWRARSVQNVLAELEYWEQNGYTSFNFIDSNFFMSKQRVIDLCDCLLNKNLSIALTSDGMRAKDADPVMLEKLQKLGLQSVAVGIESANDDILDSIKKGETVADLGLCLETLLKLDISVVAFFIIGLPGETIQHVLNSFRFALKYPNISSAYFFNPNPLPGTELYAYADKHNMLRATESQILENIGGMGSQILLETEELPISVREELHELSHLVSALVVLRHRLYRENDTIPDSDRLSIEMEIKNINSKINQGFIKLNEPKNYNHMSSIGYDKILTHLTSEEKFKLQELAIATHGMTYVELGSYLGASSCFIASGIKASGVAAKLYCIDTWNNDAMSEGNKDTYIEFTENTKQFQNIIVPLRGRSEEVAKPFDRKIDFLFIDAGHNYDDVKADVLAWFPKLKPGAQVVFHDIGWAEGVQRVIREYVKPIAYNEDALPNMYWAQVSTIQLSIIIPTRNRAVLLYNALDSLTKQTYSATNYEVIVVDNGSNDNTYDVCRHFKRRIPQLKYIYDPRPGLHNGRHTGLEAASTDILVFADDDIEALPTWLEGIAESFVDPSVALVGGKVLPKFECPPPEWIDLLSARTDSGWTLGWYSLLDFGDTAHEIPHEYVWGCNFAIRKDVLKKVGGFHPDSVPQELIKYRGDGETAVSFAIRDLGLKALYNPKASIQHVVSPSRLTPEYIYQRAFNQGVSDSYTNFRKTKAAAAQRHYSPTTDDIHEVVNRGLVDGFNYHQQMLKDDASLVEWVLRDSYIGNGDLPQ